MIKVHQPVVGGICGRCSYSQVIEYRNRTEVICEQVNPRLVIYEPVYRCNQFHNKNEPNKYDLEKIAWTLRTDGNGNKIGFERPVKDES